MKPFRTILVPTDFSADADRAYRVACSLAKGVGANLVVLSVLEPEIVYGGFIATPTPNSYQDDLRARLEEYEAPAPGLSAVHILREGRPADVIPEVARELQCDLIVLGSHGRTGLGRLLMGSVAEGTLRAAPCSVLVVKDPARAAHAEAERAGMKPATVT